MTDEDRCAHRTPLPTREASETRLITNESSLTFGTRTDCGDDFVWIAGPDERLRCGVAIIEEAVDGGLEVRD